MDNLQKIDTFLPFLKPKGRSHTKVVREDKKGVRSNVERTADLAYSSAKKYQRSQPKSDQMHLVRNDSYFTDNYSKLVGSVEHQEAENFLECAMDDEQSQQDSDKKVDTTSLLRTLTKDFYVIPNSFVPVQKVEDVLLFIFNRTPNEFFHEIHDFRLETPICTLPDMEVTVKHLDDICGLGEVETTTNWIISLLPNRQLRLETKGVCIRLYVTKEPTFIDDDDDVIVECSLVPGGHLLRLTFTMNAKKADKEKWLTINDTRWKWNSIILNYMISRPFGSMDAIYSILNIAFVDDPREVDLAIEVTEKFNCYYYKRHFYYKSPCRKFIGNIVISKWGVRPDKHALLFWPEGATVGETNYLMAIASDVNWFREWESAIYLDFKEGWTEFDKREKNHTNSIRGLLEVNIVGEEESKFSLGRFVHDNDTHELTTVDWNYKKEFIQCLRVIQRPETDTTEYDFRIDGFNERTATECKLRIRVAIPEELPSWTFKLGVSFRRAYALMEMVFRELEDKRKIVTESYTQAVTPSFRDFREVYDQLPRVECVGRLLSNLRPYHLDLLAYATFASLFEPMITLKEAKIISKKEADNIVKLCGHEKARFLELVHRHVRHRFYNDKQTKNFPSQIEIWRRLALFFTRLSDLQIDALVEDVLDTEALVEAVAQFFDRAPYSYYRATNQ